MQINIPHKHKKPVILSHAQTRSYRYRHSQQPAGKRPHYQRRAGPLGQPVAHALFQPRAGHGGTWGNPPTGDVAVTRSAGAGCKRVHPCQPGKAGGAVVAPLRGGNCRTARGDGVLLDDRGPGLPVAGTAAEHSGAGAVS